MAGGSGKRIAAQNKATLTQLRYGFLSTLAIYLLSLFLFRSGRTWSRLFYYIVTEGVGLALWQQLDGMAKKGEDLSAEGLTAYIFDVVYVTWFVHATTALISTKFWYLYLTIPAYAAYRAGKFILPYVYSPAGTGGASAPSIGAGAAGGKEAAVEMSKRQQKLKARQEKGPIRLQRQG